MQLKKIAEAVSGLMSIGVFLSAIVTGLWFVVDNDVGTKLARVTGAAQTQEAVERLIAETKQMDEHFNKRIDGIEERINQIRTTNKIFEIDDIRSLVWDNCPTDGKCAYTFRVRRTSLGQSCGRPEATRFVIDRFGVTHPVEAVSPTNKARTDGEWTEVSNAFILPENIPYGVAEFYMELSYYGCFLDAPDRRVREVTPKLIFQINKPK